MSLPRPGTQGRGADAGRDGEVPARPARRRRPRRDGGVRHLHGDRDPGCLGRSDPHLQGRRPPRLRPVRLACSASTAARTASTSSRSSTRPPAGGASSCGSGPTAAATPPWCPRSPACTPGPTGTSARPGTCSGSSSTGHPGLAPRILCRELRGLAAPQGLPPRHPRGQAVAGGQGTGRTRRGRQRHRPHPRPRGRARPVGPRRGHGRPGQDREPADPVDPEPVVDTASPAPADEVADEVAAEVDEATKDAAVKAEEVRLAQAQARADKAAEPADAPAAAGEGPVVKAGGCHAGRGRSRGRGRVLMSDLDHAGEDPPGHRARRGRRDSSSRATGTSRPAR
jgi:hypothetical protein